MEAAGGCDAVVEAKGFGAADVPLPNPNVVGAVDAAVPNTLCAAGPVVDAVWADPKML